jgi:hypothetical protein
MMLSASLTDAATKLAKVFTDDGKAGFLRVEVSDGQTNFAASGKFRAISGGL